jgi:hypothetical protein
VWRRDASKWIDEAQLCRILSEPFTHFVIAGVLLFLGGRVYQHETDLYRVVLTPQHVAKIANDYALQFGARPDPRTLSALVERDLHACCWRDGSCATALVLCERVCGETTREMFAMKLGDLLILSAIAALSVTFASAQEGPAPRDAAVKRSVAPHQRRVFFGELHLHTVMSLDAWTFGTQVTPDQAYKFARGETVMVPAFQNAGSRQHGRSDNGGVLQHDWGRGTLCSLARSRVRSGESGRLLCKSP